ncbi:MAG TPA: hypothetical protein VFE16_10620 [Candidatus Cybelea sp.]|jgi:phospholipase C|nr:hypothetical protein [Candidatus Cybelea sp.]
MPVAFLRISLIAVMAASATLAGCGGAGTGPSGIAAQTKRLTSSGKIAHVIIIIQENRSLITSL